MLPTPNSKYFFYESLFLLPLSVAENNVYENATE
tara:strand:- start:112 stop:213 length:102 start_codon:yes stop_codon:yes gene_type:complete